MSADDDAETLRAETLRRIALALDWGNVPPLDVLVKDIRARAAGARRIKLEHEKMVTLLQKLVKDRPHTITLDGTDLSLMAENLLKEVSKP